MEGLEAAMKQSLIQLQPDNHGQHGNKRLLPHGSLEEDLGQTRTDAALQHLLTEGLNTWTEADGEAEREQELMSSLLLGL